MHDRFAERLSDADAEPHAVYVGRPFGIDYVAAARHRGMARDLSAGEARRNAHRLRRYLHVHPPIQRVGASWAEVRRTKARWVEEFSRHDAGWSDGSAAPGGRRPVDGGCGRAMKILLVGALSWNPERVRSLWERGHELWGLWARSLAWDQGPYPSLDGCVRQIALEDAARTIREAQIDCVYSLFQVYDRRLWAPASPGVEHGVWAILRALLLERQRGTFDAPVVRHWGFDIHDTDLEVARTLDGHIICNPEKLAYWTMPVRDGGCGLDILGDCEVVAFLDSDRPKLEFMNDRFAERLSDADGELHTVCVGRPVGIDYVALARAGIHLHVYCNSFDDAYRMMGEDLSPRDARREVALLGRYVHVHASLQTRSGTWAEVQRTKSRWVEEFSRYDAGWSYMRSPLPWAPLDDRGAIPNRVGTYLLAGLPVITDRRTGFYRYEQLRQRGVEVELLDHDYHGLRARLEAEVRTRAKSFRARNQREAYSFDASIDALLDTLERARACYFAQPPARRARFRGDRRVRLTHFNTSPHRPTVLKGLVRRPAPDSGLAAQARRLLLSLRTSQLRRCLRPSIERARDRP